MKYNYQTGYPADSKRVVAKRRLFSFNDNRDEQVRFATEPVRVGEVLEPLQQIVDHPDRDRIMALFFKDYK